MNKMKRKETISRLLPVLLIPVLLFPNGRCGLTEKMKEVYEVRVGDSLSLNCSTDIPTEEIQWFHIPVGKKNREEVYSAGEFYYPYDSRFEMHLNRDTGAFHLFIRRILAADAGTFQCWDNKSYGERSDGQLVVLDSNPDCVSNIRGSTELIGVNDCSVKPDALELSCTTNYHGNRAPGLRWRRVDRPDEVLAQNTTGGSVVLRLNESLHRLLRDSSSSSSSSSSSFICEALNSPSELKKINCSFTIDKVLFIAENDDGVCGICEKVVKRDSGNTSNLRRHLQTNHPPQYKELLKLEEKIKEDEEELRTRKRKPSAQPNILTSFSRPTPFAADSIKVRKINKFLVQTICKDALPFYLLESDSFKSFVNELEPRYRLPTRKAMSAELIPAKYNTIKQSVMETLSEAAAVALTTDAWTSVSNEAFVGVTAHYLLEDFSYQDRCLTVKHAPGSHTAEMICKHLEDICSEWGLQHRTALLPLYVVTDNGSNMKKAVHLMKHAKWVPCFAHTLQLVINKVLSLEELSDIQNVLLTARAIVGHFRRSPLACKKLEQAQEQLGISKKRLIQDCSTRWNSQVLMLERLIEQKSAISLVLNSVSGIRNLNGDEWKAAQFLVEALRPFLDATTIVSATRYPTLSMIIPLLDGLLDVLKEEENAESIPCLRTALIDELNERFSYTRTTSSDLFFVSTVVDPRYKLVPFTDDLQAIQAKNFVVAAMERVAARPFQRHSSQQSQQSEIQPIASTSTSARIIQQHMELTLGCQSADTDERQRTKTSIWDRFDRLATNQRENSEQQRAARAGQQLLREELDLYVTENVIERSQCPFVWWNENRARFPGLAAVAREFLMIPSTSVPSERLFSKAGDVIRKKRSSLKPNKAEQTIFLMENM